MSAFGTFNHWSWSQLQMYRACPYCAWLKYHEHSPEPPPDPKKNDKARLRGIAMHDSSEHHINDGTPLCKELAPLEDLYSDLLAARDKGVIQVTAERREYFDRNWRPCTRDNYWLVVIKDISVTGATSLTIDLKSGSKWGNEIKHFGQMQLYGITDWINDPGYGEYNTELWYADQKNITPHSFTGEQLERARAVLDIEVNHMMSDEIHAPRVNKFFHKYSPYGAAGTGACPIGI